MDRVAFLWNGHMVLWRAVFIALGVLAALLLALALRVWRRQPVLPLLVSFPGAVVLSLLLGRLIHWYCRFESYGSLAVALGDPFTGEYSLMGAFAGTLAAFGLARLARLTKNLPELLDCAAPAAGLGIAAGRLGALYSALDRGKMIFETEALHRLPFAAAVANPVSGAVEWRFATFCFQSIWAALLCAGVLLWDVWQRRKGRARDGESFWLFLLLYALGQLLLDSTRYDALFLRSNGFVSLEQIICAVTALAVLVLYSVRSLRARGFRWFHPALWLLWLLGLGLAGYMEYYVQRHGDAFVLAYSLMALGLAAVFAAVRLLRRTAVRKAGTAE